MELQSHQRLLLLSCSQSKCDVSGLIPALERYNGPPFRLLRKYLASSSLDKPAPDIYIVSAKFGLISATQLIPNYDQRMTKQRACQINLSLLDQLQKLPYRNSYREIFINVGSDYRLALDGHTRFIASEAKVIDSTGSSGRRLTNLHDWLYGNCSESILCPRIATNQGEAYIRGIKIKLTPDEVLDVARHLLIDHGLNSANFQSWYILVDGQQISIKWLVGQLTGLAVSQFHSGEAKRVLQQLGLKIHKK